MLFFFFFLKTTHEMVASLNIISNKTGRIQEQILSLLVSFPKSFGMIGYQIFNSKSIETLSFCQVKKTKNPTKNTLFVSPSPSPLY